MTTSTNRLRSRADVATDAPARYAQQLVSHLGHKVAFTAEGPTFTAQLGSATAHVVVGDGVLTLLAEGPDEQGVALAEHVLGSHLERFGQRHELAVHWTRSAGGSPSVPR